MRGWRADNQSKQQHTLASGDKAVLWMQSMEYMVNCKYVEATEKSGHPVDSHCVILVSPHAPMHA